MSIQPLSARGILGAGFAMGLAGDFLLRAPGALGLNLLILFAGLATAVRFVGKRGPGLSTEGSIWIGIGLALACGLVWRGSTTLRALSFLGAATAFTFPALQAGGAWIRRAGVTDVIEAVLGSILGSAFGSTRFFASGDRRGPAPDTRSATVWRVTRLAFRGVLLAAPPLLILGALLLSADPVFAGIVSDIVTIDLELLMSHLIAVSVLTWLTCGYLSGLLAGTRLGKIRAAVIPRPSFGVGEVGTALGLINVLFVGFVIVQFRYLFGGSELVEVMAGLTYAEYAREGFFQLVIATALALPWILAADWLLGHEDPRARTVFTVLGGLQLLLLLAIVASALQRMRYYLEAYGLTELRFFATTFLIWLAVVMLWLPITVLRGRREPFVFGTLVTAFALIGVLQIANPDAVIARTNLSRTNGGVVTASANRVTQSHSVDVAYLSSLGSDAVPVLLENLSGVSEEARCHIARQLLRAWGEGSRADWRSWNWSDMRARRAVQRESIQLGRMAPEGEDCV